MKRKSKERSTTVAEDSGIERWTVERLDKDTGMARIEVVPMRAEHVVDGLLDNLMERGVELGEDRLSLWDAGRAQIVPKSIANLAEELNLRPDELETLSENMVFWLVRLRGAVRIIHATQAARQITKDLYREVILKQERKDESQ